MVHSRAMRVCTPTTRVAARPLFTVALVLLALSASILLSCVVRVAPAQALPDLSATVPAWLSAVGAPVELQLGSTLGGPWPQARLRVETFGPALPSAGVSGRSVAGRVFESELGDLAGRLDTSVAIPGDWMAQPGAYLVRATVTAGTEKVMRRELWLGKVASLPQPVDLAMVWPIARGIHRDPQDVVVDQVVQGLVVPRADSPESLYALFSAVDGFPDWHMTLAVEPVLLAQVRDLADGFTELDASGVPVIVDRSAEPAVRADEALDTLRRVAALDSVQVIPGPYAMPALPVLAREGWGDGFDQMQLGKAELQSTLQLVEPPQGAYPPGLEVTTDSLESFSRASIGYVVADPDVARDLAETAPDRRAPVRVRDGANNRLTLVFADRELRAALAPPWDPGRFAAALAAVLATEQAGPIVGVPADDYELPPASFLKEVGEILAQSPWIHTATLAETLRAHPPDTRPIFLSRYGGFVEGYVGQTFLERLRAAHARVDDLANATQSERAPLDALRLLLYQAESRYWFAKGANPVVANLGLAYLEAVEEGVALEFDKVDVAQDKSVIIVGRQGDVPVAVINQLGYPLDVVLTLAGNGVDFGAAARQKTTLGPGENIVTVPAVVSGGRVTVQVQVIAGGTLVDAASLSIRSISVGSVVPWVVGALLLGVASMLLVRRLR